MVTKIYPELIILNLLYHCWKDNRVIFLWIKLAELRDISSHDTSSNSWLHLSTVTWTSNMSVSRVSQILFSRVSHAARKPHQFVAPAIRYYSSKYSNTPANHRSSFCRVGHHRPAATSFSRGTPGTIVTPPENLFSSLHERNFFARCILISIKIEY